MPTLRRCSPGLGEPEPIKRYHIGICLYWSKSHIRYTFNAKSCCNKTRFLHHHQKLVFSRWSRLFVVVCWSLTSLCHSNGHIETMPAREINPFTALTRIRSQFLRTQWSTSNHSEWTRLRLRPLSHRGWLRWSRCKYSPKYYFGFSIHILNEHWPTVYINSPELAEETLLVHLFWFCSIFED